MLRHGYTHSPFHWQEIQMDTFKGLWISEGINTDPDIIIFYAHGGGFSMGSSYFYLEFLIAYLTLIKSAGYQRPAIFSLEYSLVPDKAYPTQLHQALAAYRNLALNHDAAKIVLSGDSAGATLLLTLLLYLAQQKQSSEARAWQVALPAMAVLISPWVTLVSPKDKNTDADYLDAANLHLYARQYAGSKTAVHDPLVSPGSCKDVEWWRKAAPSKGFFVCYGSEEVFKPEVESWVGLLSEAGIEVDSREERRGIHAWPVAALFLSSEFPSAFDICGERDDANETRHDGGTAEGIKNDCHSHSRADESVNI